MLLCLKWLRQYWLIKQVLKEDVKLRVNVIELDAKFSSEYH